jgi:hypothetical protein
MFSRSVLACSPEHGIFRCRVNSIPAAGKTVSIIVGGRLETL